jgi:hypothetical protein
MVGTATVIAQINSKDRILGQLQGNLLGNGAKIASSTIEPVRYDNGRFGRDKAVRRISRRKYTMSEYKELKRS